MKKANDDRFIGKKFGRWTVLAVGLKNGKRYGWQCRCSCGAVKVVERHNILGGCSKGCLKCRRMVGSNNPMWRGCGAVPQQYWGILLKSAAVRDIDVSIEIQDLDLLWAKQGGKCALSGLPIVLTTKHGGNTASLDRIDPEKGYTKNNIQWVHKDINRMKNAFTETRFLDLCLACVNFNGVR